MMHLLHSLRFKLTALNLLVFGLLHAGSLTAILTLRERELRGDFDDWLRADASRMMEQVLRQPTETLAPAPGSSTPQMNPFHFRGYYFQLRHADGTTLVKSANLENVELPLSDAARQASASGDPIIETIPGRALKTVSGATADIRLLTLFSQKSSVDGLCLQLGARLDRVNEAVANLRRILLMTFPVSLAAVAFGSWFMAGRALRPINDITKTVRELTVDRLGQRFGLPAPTGDLAHMVASLNEMLDRIEKGFRSQERFAAEVSHELKTPISVLLGEAQLLGRSTRTVEEHEHFAANVEAEMHRLRRTVESLLLLARANAGFPVALEADVSLNDVITEAVRRCSAVAAHWETELVPRLLLPRDNEPDPVVRGDEELLVAMATNLILNAIRHSPAGQPVTVSLSSDQQDYIIAVRDAGPGIPIDRMNRLFQPFTQLPRQAPPPEGSGLGLVIVKSIATLHGGSVTPLNLPGEGCAFLVRLHRPEL